MINDGVVFEGDTASGHYQIADTVYGGRPARVLYSGQHQAAQSGVACDDKPEQLFDYNERFMELLRGLRPQCVLLIGGGTLTLPMALIQEFKDTIVDVVEPEAGLIKLAERYFSFQPDKRLRIHLTDGRSFLARATGHYDFIVIDAFVHTTVPSSLQTVEAAASLKRHLSKRGVVAMNIIATYHGQRSVVLRRQIAAFQTAFTKVELFPAGHGLSLWGPQNFVLVAGDYRRSLQRHFRYQAIALLSVGSDDAVND